MEQLETSWSASFRVNSYENSPSFMVHPNLDSTNPHALSSLYSRSLWSDEVFMARSPDLFDVLEYCMRP